MYGDYYSALALITAVRERLYDVQNLTCESVEIQIVMSDESQMMSDDIKAKDNTEEKADDAVRVIVLPLPNYTLASVCPACNASTVRRACKVRCERCGFVWDCGEL